MHFSYDFEMRKLHFSYDFDYEKTHFSYDFRVRKLHFSDKGGYKTHLSFGFRKEPGLMR